MTVLDQVRFVIYRFHEKGLEVLLINNKMEQDPEVWKIPAASLKKEFNSESFILLDEHVAEDGRSIKTIAIEADWHEIPSIRGMIKHDVNRVKSKIKRVLPDLEHGSYFVAKEAFKKVLPNEYKTLKELKDILLDRNTLMNI